MENKKEHEKSYIIQSVQKTLSVLKIFDNNNNSLSLKEISDKLGYNKSNVFRILETLKSEGFVSEDAYSKKYSLGINLYHLGNIVFESMNIRKIATPHMQSVSNKLNVTCHLGIIDIDQVVIIEKTLPEKNNPSLRMLSYIGGSVPFHCTGVGKILLAYSDDNVRHNLLETMSLTKYTATTITEKKKLIEELDLTRNRGYAISNMEHEEYIKCYTYPIFDHDGKIAFALSLTGFYEFIDNLDNALIHEVGNNTATRISRELGYSDGAACSS